MKAARTAKGKDDIGTEEGQPAESEHENDHCNRLRGPLLFCHTNFLPFSKHCGRILKMTSNLAKMARNSFWTYRLVVLLRLHRPAMPIMCILHVLRRGLLVRRLRSIPICCLKEETPFGYSKLFCKSTKQKVSRLGAFCDMKQCNKWANSCMVSYHDTKSRTVERGNTK